MDLWRSLGGAYTYGGWARAEFDAYDRASRSQKIVDWVQPTF